MEIKHTFTFEIPEGGDMLTLVETLIRKYKAFSKQVVAEIAKEEQPEPEPAPNGQTTF